MGEIWSVRGTDTTLLILRCRGSNAGTIEGPLGNGGKHEKALGSHWEQRPSPGWQQARKYKPRSYNHKELDSANNLNKFGSEFLPNASIKEYGPVNMFNLTQ